MTIATTKNMNMYIHGFIKRERECEKRECKKEKKKERGKEKTVNTWRNEEKEKNNMKYERKLVVLECVCWNSCVTLCMHVLCVQVCHTGYQSLGEREKEVGGGCDRNGGGAACNSQNAPKPFFVSTQHDGIAVAPFSCKMDRGAQEHNFSVFTQSSSVLRASLVTACLPFSIVFQRVSTSRIA